ncbi:MAG: adenosylcobinamide-GDP ribazoletransferase [Lachnospiraceae bacterium]|nr:adenosylcobinamide-GDP ribazoletransferase [Lachnospiraceae bacterium]
MGKQKWYIKREMIFKTLAIAFSMYTVIPMPKVSWEKDNLRYVFIAFPLVGIVIGIIGYGAYFICDMFKLPDVVFGMIFTLLPIVVTGGIHLDGYADTSDALYSHADNEKKLRIMDDPHTGAFAAICLCSLFIIVFSLWSGIRVFDPVLFTCGMMLSRILTGITVMSFPLSKSTGLLYTFSESADKKRVRFFLIIFDMLVCAVMSLRSICGVLMVLISHALLLFYYLMTKREFKGISGDTSGWFIVQSEKWMLILAAAYYFIANKIL